jgi:Na+/proline symporter
MIGFWDWVLILTYAGLIIGVGLRVGRREKSLEAFILAGRQVPWWAVLGSIIAAETSAAIHFTWRLFFGTVATFATAVCWPARSVNA